MNILKKLALAVFAAALVVVVQAAPAKAYSNENMIDNAVFDAKDAMNEAQIRAFIQSRPNTCLTRVGSGLGGGNIFDEPMDYFNYGPNKVDAARVIYKAAQYNEINPRVILATLQKEQGLITDNDCVSDIPSLNKAMGYACYEGADACPASWAAGFERQVMKGAWQLAFDRQRAEGNTSWGGNDSINYGGRMTEGNRRRCGSCALIYYDGYSVIDGVNTRMGNGATASLYNYTPHRNQSFPYWFEFFFGEGSTAAVTTNWRFEALDGSASAINIRESNAGPTPSSIAHGDYLYNFYYDVSQGTLRSAVTSSTTGWQFKSLDGQGLTAGQLTARVGQFSTPIIYDNQVHVFYYDLANKDLRHAWTADNGTNWQYETLDGNSSLSGKTLDDVGYTVSATVYNNTIQLFYYNQTKRVLRHSWYSVADGWKFEDLDGSITGVSRYSSQVGQKSSVQAYQNTIQLFYWDERQGDLRHAWFSPDYGWRFEDLDGNMGSVSRYEANVGLDSTTVIYQNTIQVFYKNLQRGSLRHAFFIPGQGWRFEDLDGGPASVSRYTGTVGTWPSVSVYNDTMQLVYYNSSNASTRHAFFIPGWGWGFEEFDGGGAPLSRYSGNIGLQSTITQYQNSIQAFYLDAGRGDVRHAWFTP